MPKTPRMRMRVRETKRKKEKMKNVLRLSVLRFSRQGGGCSVSLWSSLSIAKGREEEE
jgi:hypothetical protein